jgi:hypothetical protein
MNVRSHSSRDSPNSSIATKLSAPQRIAHKDSDKMLASGCARVRSTLGSSIDEK